MTVFTMNENDNIKWILLLLIILFLIFYPFFNSYYYSLYFIQINYLYQYIMFMYNKYQFWVIQFDKKVASKRFE